MPSGTVARASLILLTYNSLNYTRQCLESIYTKTIYPEFEVIVVDNASTDGTPEFLEAASVEYENFKIQLNDHNEGFARGNNQGVQLADGEYLVFLNNDTIVTEGWLTALLGHLDNPQIGMVGPVTNSSSNETRILVGYDQIEDMERFAQEYTRAHAGEHFEIRVLPFLCVALRREVFDEIGPLDEQFGLGMFEDDDYCQRLREKNYQIVCAEDVFIHHWGGGSFHKMDPQAYWQLFWENRTKFEQKWDITWQPHLQRPELLARQAIELSEWGYNLQRMLLLSESQVQTLLPMQMNLEAIHQSTTWKMMERLWRVRHGLIPPGSQREKWLFALLGKTSQAVTSLEAAAPTITSDQVSEKRAPTVLTGSGREVAILAPQFYDLQGSEVFLGGAERYLVELALLVRSLGYTAVIYQSAQGSWEREYRGFRVIGLDSGGDRTRLNQLFEQAVPDEVLAIYLAFYLAAPHAKPRSIGISHGIFWDNKNYTSYVQQNEQFTEILAPIQNLTRVVSVDTNTINWVRTLQTRLADKFVYIPNFVDTDRFQPPETRLTQNLKVLYPRRLYPPRGFWLVKEIIPEFLAAYPQIEFDFVGQANLEEEIAVQELVRTYPERVSWRSLPMDEMYRAYQQADITLIPTLHSEGTSLSCLEAMASGNAIIATNVGGLPDLILSGYNGLLIEPNAASLRDGLHLLCQDAEQRERFARRALEIAPTFNLSQWRIKWKKVLGEFIRL
ncbi:MAG: glycosyltransferase [Anaerolineales bacterium]|jgi:GT2 family glycosyltransferase/glycosyltransferase involved in cell wall biosynthesis